MNTTSLSDQEHNLINLGDTLKTELQALQDKVGMVVTPDMVSKARIVMSKWEGYVGDLRRTVGEPAPGQPEPLISDGKKQRIARDNFLRQQGAR